MAISAQHRLCPLWAVFALILPTGWPSPSQSCISIWCFFCPFLSPSLILSQVSDPHHSLKSLPPTPVPSLHLSHYLQLMFAHLTPILASEFWKTQLAWSPHPTPLKQPLSLLRKLFLSRNFHMYKHCEHFKMVLLFPFSFITYIYE